MEDDNKDNASDATTDQTATLDPPGSIAVVGAGPLGIEAALYGRYLGYDVTLLEAVAVAGSMTEMRGDAIPMLPDRCASPLALGALAAQQSDDQPKTLPTTIGQWIDQVWLPLTESDLMRGRLQCPACVKHLDFATSDGQEDESDQDDESDDEIPPDFRLTLETGETKDFEAVILAVGASAMEISRPFSGPVEYLFEVGETRTGHAEADFLAGLKQIVAVYASLGGRPDLDLYCPRRVGD